MKLQSKVLKEEWTHKYKNGLVLRRIIEEVEENKTTQSTFYRTDSSLQYHLFKDGKKAIKYGQEYDLSYVSSNAQENEKYADLLKENKLDEFDYKTVDFDNVISPYGSHDTFIHQASKEEPITNYLTFDYISGFNSAKIKDLDKAVKLIEKKKRVVKESIRIDNIEWYNQDTCGTSGIYFICLPPQKLIEELYHKHKGNSYSSGRIKGEFGYEGLYETGEDVFGLKSLLIKDEY